MTNNKDKKVLNVPNLRFPEFTDKWEVGKLEEYILLVSGQDLSSEQYTDKEDVYPYITGASSLNSEGIILNRWTHTPTQIVKRGDILLVCKGSGVGQLTVLSNVDKAHIARQIMGIRAKNIESQLFIYHYLSRLMTELKKRSTGIIPGIDRKSILSLHISIPSLQEQQKVAELLSLIEQRIITQNKIIEKLKSLIKGIGNKLLFNDTWKPTQLCDILTERIEKSKTNNQHEVLSSTVKGIYSQREYFSKDIASENNIGYKIIYLHDVVLSPQNLWMGNINYNNRFDVGIVSPSYKIYWISPKFDKNFIASILKTHRALYNYQLISEQGASVVRRNLNTEAFEQLTFRIPPYDLQVKIGRTLSLLQKKLDNAFTIKQAYDQQKQYLLSQMFI